MKKLISTALVAVSVIAGGAVYQDGKPRGQKWPDIKIVLRQGENMEWRIQEDAAFFVARFATVNPIFDMMNKAETRELAKAVAVAVATHLGSTNDVLIVRREVPTPSSTNIIDRLEAALSAKDIVEEVVPLH